MRVNIDDWFSSPLNISCNVPQGSVLEPLFFYIVHNSFELRY